MLPKSNTVLPLPWLKRGKCYTNWNFDHCCLPWLPAYTGIQNEKVTKCWPNLNRDRCGLAYFECLMLPFDTHHFVPDVQGGVVVFVFVFVFVFLYSFCATRFQTLPVAHQVSWPKFCRKCVGVVSNLVSTLVRTWFPHSPLLSPDISCGYHISAGMLQFFFPFLSFFLFFRLPTLVFPVLVLVVPGQSCPRPIPVTSWRFHSV